MLRFGEGTQGGDALVLRAGRARASIVLRRLAVTLLAVAVFGGSVYAATRGTDCVSWVAVPIGGAILAAILLGLSPREVVELRIAGDGTVRVVERGSLGWLTKVSYVRAPLRYLAGLVPVGGGSSLGLALCDETGAEHRFSVEGVDRRDEARKLAHLLAARLGTGIEIVQDDVFFFVADLGEGRAAPSVEVTGGAYRTAAAAPSSVDATRPPSFEPPPQEPPRFVVGSSTELRDTVGVFDPDEGRFAATMAEHERGVLGERLRRRLRASRRRILIAAEGLGFLGLAIGWAVDHPFAGLGIGVALGVAVPLGMLLATSLVTSLGGAIGSGLFVVGLVLRGEPMKPGALGGVRPRGWTIDVPAGVIELRGSLRTRRVPTERARTVAIVADDAGREHALYLRLGSRWVSLLRSRWVPGHDRPMIERLPALASIATELARALDVPIRYVR